MKIKRIVTTTPCYVCDKVGGSPTKRKNCKCCKGTGKYKEYHYMCIFGNKAIDMDTLK